MASFLHLLTLNHFVTTLDLQTMIMDCNILVCILASYCLFVDVAFSKPLGASGEVTPESASTDTPDASITGCPKAEQETIRVVTTVTQTLTDENATSSYVVVTRTQDPPNAPENTEAAQLSTSTRLP